MSIYFTVMSSNEPVASVEIREVTTGTHGYSVTPKRGKPSHRSTISTPEDTDPMSLIAAVLTDYTEYQHRYRQAKQHDES